MENSKFIEGVNLIYSYMTKDKAGDNNAFSLAAKHDQIWFGAYELVTKKEDIERLKFLGWRKDEDAWSCFT